MGGEGDGRGGGWEGRGMGGEGDGRGGGWEGRGMGGEGDGSGGVRGGEGDGSGGVRGGEGDGSGGVRLDTAKYIMPVLINSYGMSSSLTFSDPITDGCSLV